jgi:hypothetical protein
VTFSTAAIHVTGTRQEQKQRMRKSGLFGIHEETTAELVGVRDHARLKRYAEFNRDHGSPNDVCASYLFQQYEADCFEEQYGLLEKVWLHFLYRWALETNSLHTIVPPITRPLYRFGPGVRIDRSDPWVRNALHAMPKFRPVYLIRVCINHCL